MDYVIAFDLGTGGVKASLFNEEGKSLSGCFVSYPTYYPQNGYHEQRPADWWNAILESTDKLLKTHEDKRYKVIALSVSGHSLGAVPIDKSGKLLVEKVPIWSDFRAVKQAYEFFSIVDKREWYMITGNGFPAHLYSIFKQMWYKDNMTDMYEDTYKFLGTKDYINYILTGRICTDYSYASGSGVYDLKKWVYKEEYITVSGICRDKFTEIVPSTEIIGTLKKEVSETMGLNTDVMVVCGGVDNACMALGAGCIKDGMAYTSLGSSAWLTVSGHEPIVDYQKKPYVFTHCIPDMYVSATSIFCAGSAFRWLHDTFCCNLIGGNLYDEMAELAKTSPVGAKSLFFNPTMAGGTSLDKSINIKGGFIGLQLEHTQADIIRAVLEGVCLNLKIALNTLEQYVEIKEDMLIVGGGGKNQFWRSLFADIYNKNIIETNVGEDAGSLGAFAVAAVGAGLWKDFDTLTKLHEIKEIIKPNKINTLHYKKMLPVFKQISDMLSDIGDSIEELKV